MSTHVSLIASIVIHILFVSHLYISDFRHTILLSDFIYFNEILGVFCFRALPGSAKGLALFLGFNPDRVRIKW